MTTLLFFILLAGCGTTEKITEIRPGPPAPTPVPTPNPGGGDLDFVRDIQPVLRANCALSGCHGPGGMFAGENEFLISDGPRRILNGSMPPSYSPKFGQWTEDKKQLVLTWYDQNM